MLCSIDPNGPISSLTSNDTLQTPSILEIVCRACQILRWFTYCVQVSSSGPADMVPFIVAAEKGHCDILQLLVAHGAKVNIQVHIICCLPCE